MIPCPFSDIMILMLLMFLIYLMFLVRCRPLSTLSLTSDVHSTGADGKVEELTASISKIDRCV